MPHSSGGGSSGGGLRGGSGSSSPKFGSHYYRGAHRYVFYRDNQPYYYFSDEPYTLGRAKAHRVSLIISGFFIIFCGVAFIKWGLLAGIHIPMTVSTNYDTTIVIHDFADAIPYEEEHVLYEYLQDFQNRTGITPAFVSVPSVYWKNSYESLEVYAMKTYVDMFADEKHWLVVYSSDGDRNTFEWEGIIGDYCGPMINSSLEHYFTKTTQNNLWASSRYTVATAIGEAFKATANKAENVDINMVPIIVLGGIGIITSFGGFCCIWFALKHKPEDDPRINSTQCQTDIEEPKKTVCNYCNGVYVDGLHLNCPHCGAPVKVVEQ